MADDRWRDDDRRRWEEERRRYGGGEYGWAGPSGADYGERGGHGGDYGHGQDFGRRYGVSERWRRGFEGPGEPWGGGYGHGYMGYGADWGPYGPGYSTRGYWGGYGPGTRGYQGRGYGQDWRGGWGPASGGWGYEGGRGDWRGGQERGWWDRMSDEVSSWFGDEEAERRRRFDEARGGHYGRGPRGYTRSDDRIKEDVCDRLTDDWRVDASDIGISVNQSEVTLDGTVGSREERRRAEDLAESVSGVRHVQNNLRVAQGGSMGATTGMTGLTGQSGATGTTRASETTTGAGRSGSRSR